MANLCVQVVRSADLVSYAAEEGIRILSQGRFCVSDCFPGNGRNKLCLASKVIATLDVTKCRVATDFTACKTEIPCLDYVS